MDGNFNSNVIYYFNDSTILKFLRNVLKEINPGYVDLGIRSAFLLKCYVEKYQVFEDKTLGPRLALLCMLKDIGTFYKSGEIKRRDHALAAASSYSFMKNCSPFGEHAKPLLYYMSKYVPGCDDMAERCGLLMSLVNQIIEYNYQEYTLEQIEELIKNDKRGIFHPEQVKNIFRMLYEDPSIFEELNDDNSLFKYTTSKYISSANYPVSELLRFIDMATFTFEFQDSETLAHTVTVGALAEELARRTRLPDSMIAEIKLAALVHDIGKIRVPLEILTFPGKLNEEQFKEMRKHVEYTRDIITGCFSYQIVNIASHHHEKLDGSGYPEGLKEKDLSIGDKIIVVADICSALYCRRSYKGSFDDTKIKSILKEDMLNGKLDKRVCEHLFRDWDDIMEVMKSVEKVVLDEYETMKKEYDALTKSEALYKLFDYVDDVPSIFDEEEYVEEEVLEETEEPQEEVVYVDSDGNEIDPSLIDENSEIIEEILEEVVLNGEDNVEEVIEEITVIEEEEVLEDTEESEESNEKIEELDEEDEFETNIFKPEHIVIVTEKPNPEEEAKIKEENDKAFNAFASALENKNKTNETLSFEEHLESITNDLESKAKAREENEFEEYLKTIEEKVEEKEPEEDNNTSDLEKERLEEELNLNAVASTLRDTEIVKAKEEIFGDEEENLDDENDNQELDSEEVQESNDDLISNEESDEFVEEVIDQEDASNEESETESESEDEDDDGDDDDDDEDDEDDDDDEDEDDDDEELDDPQVIEELELIDNNSNEVILDNATSEEIGDKEDLEKENESSDDWENFLKEVAAEEERLKKEGFNQ